MGDENYAQHVRKVREILGYISPASIPGAESYVEGVLNVRGDIVTIVSGQHILGLHDATQTCTHIIVLETNNGLVGISVGEVCNIALLRPEQMMQVNIRQSGSPVWGTIQHDEQLLILTDFERSITELDSL